MKNTLYITVILLCAVLASCNKDTADDAARGAVTLSLGVATGEEQNVASRAAMDDAQLLASATVKIYNGDFSGLVRQYDNSSKPQTIYLPTGNYRVDVEAGEAVKKSPSAASWEQKSYKGSAPFDITAGTVTDVQVVARVSNIITRATFDPSIADTFAAGYTLTIGLSESDAARQLVYDAAKGGKDGYFIADDQSTLYWTFSGTLKSGSTFQKSGSIENAEQGKRYAMNLKYSEKDGGMTFTLAVDMATEDKDDIIIFEPVSTGLSKSSIYEIWAGHATVHADVDEAEYGTENIRFEYRATGTEQWTSVVAERDEEGLYSKRLTGLTPATEYEYRLVVPDSSTAAPTVMGESMTFTTEAAPAIPNASFEETSNDESSKYKSFYNPASSVAENRTMWWGTGNEGSTSAGSKYVITYPDTDTKMDGNQSVCLTSLNAIIKFAAGNIFSGRFGETIIESLSKSGGTVYFGRPFTARPTKLRFWAKYSTGKITHEGGPEGNKLTTDDFDSAQIKIALGTWDPKIYGGDQNSPVLVNTLDQSTFVDYANDTKGGTIAYGSETIAGDAQNSTNEWRQITIPIEYYNTDKYPTHIIISCASSIYGDYFAGSTNSKLWLDGMELIYE